MSSEQREEFRMNLDMPFDDQVMREPTPEQVEEEGAAFMGLMGMGGTLPGVKAGVAAG